MVRNIASHLGYTMGTQWVAFPHNFWVLWVLQFPLTVPKPCKKPDWLCEIPLVQNGCVCPVMEGIPIYYEFLQLTPTQCLHDPGQGYCK